MVNKYTKISGISYTFSNKLSVSDYFVGERDFLWVSLFLKYRVVFHVFFR